LNQLRIVIVELVVLYLSVHGIFLDGLLLWLALLFLQSYGLGRLHGLLHNVLAGSHLLSDAWVLLFHGAEREWFRATFVIW